MQIFFKLFTLYLLGTFSQNYAFTPISIYPGRAPSNMEYNTRRASASDYGELSDNRFPRIKRGGDFKDLVTQSTVFADKSLFIKDVFEDGDKSLLIAMPRRWGKSVNLDMLRRFLEIPVDANGNRRDKSETDNYKLFAGGQLDDRVRGKVTLSPLKVAKTSFFNNVNALEIQGTRPVVYIDFMNCQKSNYEGVLDAIKEELRKSFKQHAYLKDSVKLLGEDKKLIKKYMGSLSSQTLNEREVMLGLKFLSEMLCMHHDQKVWILVDEYDAVVNKAYREFSESDCKKTINLLQGIYEAALKSNPYLEKGVLTGVQYIAQSGMLSGLNNLGKVDFTDDRFAQHYGLDQDEVNVFFDHFSVPRNLSTKAKDWYNGYKAPKYTGNTTVTSQVFIKKCNVWSIVSYLKERKFYIFKSHWEKSGSIYFLDALFANKEIREKIEQLVNGNCIYLERISDFSINNFKTLKTLLGGNKRVTPDGIKVLFSYLFIGGYLTIDGSRADHYRLPNMEITYEMVRRLIRYYRTIHTVDAAKKIEQVTDLLQ